ncbi:MAG: class I SAM-dependent methyltransferase [Candidatus Krumholzibacteriia bacterium]
MPRTIQRNGGRKLSRRTADRHLLYQWSVQNADFEVRFIDRAFRRLRGRRALSLREDFCGTALLSSTWVREHPDRSALGLDLDTATLQWAHRHNLSSLGEAARRIDLRESDVRTVTQPGCDAVCAYNFSWYLIHPLPRLVEYFRAVYRSLADDGLFFMDCYGGWEAQQLVEEPREVDGPQGRFTYIWDQAGYNPIDNMATCYIHFEFPGGGRWEKAFTYRWRLYTLAEVRDVLELAGFKATHVYWDRSEDEDENEFRPARRAENTPGWLAYVVGEK